MVDGFVEAGFEDVADAFARNFTEHHEVGAAFAAPLAALHTASDRLRPRRPAADDFRFRAINGKVETPVEIDRL